MGVVMRVVMRVLFFQAIFIERGDGVHADGNQLGMAAGGGEACAGAERTGCGADRIQLAVVDSCASARGEPHGVERGSVRGQGGPGVWAGTDGPVVRADDGFRAEGPASVI